jgi:hypothetical protein
LGFHKNVFVNCPFDDEYRLLLRPLLFTISYLGFRPRIALEELDSGAPRIEKIIDLIRHPRPLTAAGAPQGRVLPAQYAS